MELDIEGPGTEVDHSLVVVSGVSHSTRLSVVCSRPARGTFLRAAAPCLSARTATGGSCGVRGLVRSPASVILFSADKRLRL